MQDFALNAQGLQTPLKNGDLLTVQAITPELANAVTLRGNVAQPARLAFKEGMRIRDLIPNQEALISRDSVRRQNEALFDVNQRERTQRDREMIPDDLLADAEVNGPLQQRDARSPVKTPANTLESFRDMRQTRSFAANTGAVPLLANSIGNLYDEINWDYAVVERINRKDLSVVDHTGHSAHT